MKILKPRPGTVKTFYRILGQRMVSNNKMILEPACCHIILFSQLHIRKNASYDDCTKALNGPNEARGGTCPKAEAG